MSLHVNMARHRSSTPSAIALHRLPVQLRMLVRVMGEAGAFALVQARGGTPFTVPKHLHSAHGERLLDLCGSPDAAARLVAELPGETIQLPKYDAVLRQLRHQRVLQLRREGRQLAEIAMTVGYTVRQVINVLNAGALRGELSEADAPADDQLDMFGHEDDLADA